jgi:glycine dehydrogenase subunit 1
MVTAATLYMSLMGPAGMAQAAKHSHANTRLLVEKLTAIEGVEVAFNSPLFHECVLRINTDVDDLIRAITAQGIIAGKPLESDYDWNELSASADSIHPAHRRCKHPELKELT